MREDYRIMMERQWLLTQHRRLRSIPAAPFILSDV